MRPLICMKWNKTVVHVDPEHPKHARWVTCLVSTRATEELGRFQLPGILSRSFISVKHEVMDLVTVSLCVQIAIDKRNCVCCP
jgi:hypothetical protein